MTKLSIEKGNFSSILNASDAITNWPAFFLLAASFLGCTLIFLLGELTKTPILIGLFTLFSAIILLYGCNAVGILLYREAEHGNALSIKDAVLLSLRTSHRLIVLLCIFIAILALVMILASLILLICKIPYLGPILFAVAAPSLTVVFGVLLLAQTMVFIPLSACAVWDGQTITESLGTLLSIVRKKLLSVTLQMLFLIFIFYIIIGVLAVILALGSGITVMLSKAILDLLFLNLFGMPSLIINDEYVYAASFGSTILLSIFAVFPALLTIKGIGVIFKNASDDVASSSAQANEVYGEAKNLFEKARGKATNAAQKVKNSVKDISTSKDSSANKTVSVEPTNPLDQQAIERINTAINDSYKRLQSVKTSNKATLARIDQLNLVSTTEDEIARAKSSIKNAAAELDSVFAKLKADFDELQTNSASFTTKDLESAHQIIANATNETQIAKDELARVEEKICSFPK